MITKHTQLMLTHTERSSQVENKEKNILKVIEAVGEKIKALENDYTIEKYCKENAQEKIKELEAEMAKMEKIIQEQATKILRLTEGGPFE